MILFITIILGDIKENHLTIFIFPPNIWVYNKNSLEFDKNRYFVFVLGLNLVFDLFKQKYSIIFIPARIK